ncbi:MAG TPA: Imm1 family immunity protein [Streptosporangiaceae bacterium]|jgi:hypothetical protein
MTLIMWRGPGQVSDQQQHIQTPGELDATLDRLHSQATADRYPQYILIYPGDCYPEDGHGEADRWVPADPGDGPRPELVLTIGAVDSPVYWYERDGREHASQGTAHDEEPEFEYFCGGQQSYAPAWSLIPHEQAREAARQFVATGGQRPDNITWHDDGTR